ncbi:uncharacterized protein [Argopecten irradians]|uniref:uncharacterized protein n=1 Tax=Argopecten irradians TaxID=31199 RepID=UPI00371132E0
MTVFSLKVGGCPKFRYYIPCTNFFTTVKNTHKNCLILAITVSVCIIVLIRRYETSSFNTSRTQDSHRDFFPSNNPIPETSILQTLDVTNVSSLYFRYVNSLQVFCPVKKVYGGVKFGWYTCDVVRMGNPCVAYMIGEQVTGDFFKEVKEDYNCEENVIKKS